MRIACAAPHQRLQGLNQEHEDPYKIPHCCHLARQHCFGHDINQERQGPIKTSHFISGRFEEPERFGDAWISTGLFRSLCTHRRGIFYRN